MLALTSRRLLRPRRVFRGACYSARAPGSQFTQYTANEAMGVTAL
jgi:hypothetical protein